MTLAAGFLNARIEIHSREQVRDELNQPTDVWMLQQRRWAFVKGNTGMATIRQSASQDGVTRDMNFYSFRVRYSPQGIDSGMRVFYAGRYFDIKQIRHDFVRREWTDLVCETGGNDG